MLGTIDGKAEDRSEAGYLLLEVLIGAALSSTLLLLLLSSLNNLSRSQERTLRIVEEVSQSVFERTLTRNFFQSIRPTYRTDDAGFRGAAQAFSGRAYLDGLTGLAGSRFEAGLTERGGDWELELTAGERTVQLARFEGDGCRFVYYSWTGAGQAEWTGDEEVAEINVGRARYAHPVPNRIKLECGTQFVGSWDLSAGDWPQPRGEDATGFVTIGR